KYYLHPDTGTTFSTCIRTTNLNQEKKKDNRGWSGFLFAAGDYSRPGSNDFHFSRLIFNSLKEQNGSTDFRDDSIDIQNLLFPF
ncbi:MAG: hypothetical protein LC660_15555, partial [Desulfobacteraceae bacterium]|nr:hypothetical protein [Desulfobacteraceae bacterium]